MTAIRLVFFSLLIFLCIPIDAGANCIEGNCTEGTGVKKFPDGNRYEGEFLFGRANGNGILYFPDGSSYSGFWADGRPHGKGIYRHFDGRIYEGSFIKGIPAGRSEFNEALKAKQQGSFSLDSSEPPASNSFAR